MLSRLAFLFLLSTTSLYGESPANPWCPVQPEEAAVTRFQTDWDGQTIYFCCADCIDTFIADAKAYVPNLPESMQPTERPAWRETIDRWWNAAANFPGLGLGVLVLAAMGIARWRFGNIPWMRAATSRIAVGAVAAATVAGEAVSAHILRLQRERAVAEMERERKVHFATFHDYGHPPVPSKPDIAPRVRAVFYRGNDERSQALFNGGHYRTSTFHLDLCDAEGNALGHLDRATLDDLFLRVRVERAPGTADYFWTAERMANMFATRESGKFMGRDADPGDATSLKTVAHMQQWEFRYPIASFGRRDEGSFVEGIVYLCEKRFDDAGACLGSRFHYAFQFDLNLSGDVLRPGSDLWMGALYRSSVIPIWEIPGSEWLSPDPIPVIDGPNSKDPELLGIAPRASSKTSE